MEKFVNKKALGKNRLKKTSKYSRHKKNLKKAKAFRLWSRRFILIFSCLFVLAFLCFSVYFVLCKVFIVKDISVKGETMYNSTEIKNSSGIKLYDSLLTVNSATSEANIFSELPYIEKVKIKKQIPNKIDILVEGAHAMYCLNVQGEYLVISEYGKILENSDEKFSELVKVDGINSCSVQGKKIKYESQETEKLITEIIKTFKSKDLNLIKRIDLSDSEDIIVNYDGRIDISLGSKEDMDYKVLTAKEIIKDKVGAHEKGILDLKTLKQENRSYFYEK